MDKSDYLVILTGTRGLLGSAFVDYCIEQGIKYETFLPFPCSLERLKEKLEGRKVTHFFNCCGFSNDAESIKVPYEVFQTNSLCVLNQLESIRKFSPTTKYFNFGSIYEKTKKTPYARSKILARELIHSYIDNHKLSCWMPYLSFTEYCKAGSERFLPKIIRGMIERKLRVIKGEKVEDLVLYNKADYFHFCWATDICHAVFNLSDKENPDISMIPKDGTTLWNIVEMIDRELVGENFKIKQDIKIESGSDIVKKYDFWPKYEVFAKNNPSVVRFEYKGSSPDQWTDLDEFDNIWDTWHMSNEEYVLPKYDLGQIIEKLVAFEMDVTQKEEMDRGTYGKST